MMTSVKRTNTENKKLKKEYLAPKLKKIGDIRSKTLGKTSGTGDAGCVTPPFCQPS